MKKHIHFIGIGGIGMSALARFFVHEGNRVTGSDRERSIITEGLEKLGIEINYDQNNTTIYNSVPEGGSAIDMVVYTEAMSHDHPEMVAARSLDVPMMNYFQALGQVANPYYLIAIAGTHGKTTTTAMLADILEEASYDPTVIVGSLRSKTGSNFRAGQSKYAVVEACEYKRDFLTLLPDVLVITNIEHEHVDYYKDLADVQSAFAELVAKVPEDGAIVTDTTDTNIAPVLQSAKAKIIDYRELVDVLTPMHQPGLHVRLDAAAATTAAAFIGISAKESKTALQNFAGTWRRYEFKGNIVAKAGGLVPVYDDYGHHPTEICATIAGTRELYPDKRLIVVFQSHTYSRTHELFDDFVSALVLADRVVLLPIYAAREENTSGVSSQQLAEAVQAQGTPAQVIQTMDAATLHIKEKVVSGDVVVVMGAGEVTEVANKLTKK